MISRSQPESVYYLFKLQTSVLWHVRWIGQNIYLVFHSVEISWRYADYLLFMLCSLFGEHLMTVSVMLQMFSLHQNFLYHHDFPLCSIHFLKQSEMVWKKIMPENHGTRKAIWVLFVLCLITWGIEIFTQTPVRIQ